MKKIIEYVLIIIISGFIGAMLGTIIGNVDLPILDALFEVSLIYLIIILILSILLHTFIHEAGHLIFGLISGYTFLSYRVFNLELIKIDNQLQFKKYSLAGTAGQCLMAPPELKNDTIPVFLYNMGGGFLNIIVSVVAIIIACIVSNYYVIATLVCFGFIGIFFGLGNIIPFSTGEINNDGKNTVELLKNKDSVKAFYMQLKIAEYQTKGIRLKDMDPSIFNFKEDMDFKNSLLVSQFGYKENYLMDQHKFDEAYTLIEYLFNNNFNLLGIYKNLLMNDYIYIKLLRNDLNVSMDNNLKQFNKAMKNQPFVLRTMYAYTLKVENDIDKANAYLDTFNKISNSYPYSGEIESERELIELIWE